MERRFNHYLDIKPVKLNIHFRLSQVSRVSADETLVCVCVCACVSVMDIIERKNRGMQQTCSVGGGCLGETDKLVDLLFM